MSSLLIEIGVEELPASFVAKAMEQMPVLVKSALAAARLTHGEIEALGTPRRLALRVEDVADAQPDLEEEVLGPPRAAAFDRHMAASLGVPVGAVYAGTFAFGVALAGLSGVLLAPIYSVFPTMGRDFVLIAFSVVIIGGMGSIKGAVIAGLLLTQVQSISSLFISPVWSDPLLFSIMVGVLMWRPHGLFGKLGHG